MAKRYSKTPIANEDAYQKKLEITRQYLNTNTTLFEFGCGTGSTAVAHAPYVNEILAIDFPEKMLEIARAKAGNSKIQNIKFDQATIEFNVLEVRIPAEIVWGMNDPILAKALPMMKRNFPDAPVTETEAGHFLQEEVPNEIAAALLRVIDQIQRTQNEET